MGIVSVKEGNVVKNQIVTYLSGRYLYSDIVQINIEQVDCSLIFSILNNSIKLLYESSNNCFNSDDPYNNLIELYKIENINVIKNNNNEILHVRNLIYKFSFYLLE